LLRLRSAADAGIQETLRQALLINVGVEGISELRKIMLSALLRDQCVIGFTLTCFHTLHDYVLSSDPLIGITLKEQSRLRGRGTLLRSSTTAWVAVHQVSQGKEINICKIHLCKWEDYCKFLNEWNLS
jgi:hypothetical protein